MDVQEEQELKNENERLRKELSRLKKETELLTATQPFHCLSQFLIDKMDAIIFVKDVVDGFRYYMANERFCAMQNLSQQDIIGKDDYDIFPADVAEKYRRGDEAAVATGGEYSYQEELHIPGQENIIVQTTKSYVVTSEGNKLLVCIAYDITKAVQKEKMLEKAVKDEKEAHQMMRTIFRKLPSAILIKDIEDDYRFYIINKKFEQMCNMSQEELIGKTDYEVFPKDEADGYRKDDMEASNYTEEAPMLIHEIVTSPDRDVSTHLQTVKFSFTFKGKRLLVCVGIDVTLQHQMMDQLQAALDKAEESDRLKSQFIANMSHEIRTPLNSIVGFSQLIAEAESKEKQEEYNRIVAFNNNLLLTLFEDILNLSILDSGKMIFKNVAFNFPTMFSDLAIQMNAKVNKPEVQFICENPLKKLMVRADRDRLTQIVTNLIANAVKFTQRGYIKMGYVCKDGGLELYVEDTGMGIEEQNLPKIFERFKKLNSFIQGTGLGLPICQSITEQMGGRIWVESEYGKGSIFHVWLPCLCKESEGWL